MLLSDISFMGPAVFGTFLMTAGADGVGFFCILKFEAESSVIICASTQNCRLQVGLTSKSRSNYRQGTVRKQKNPRSEAKRAKWGEDQCTVRKTCQRSEIKDAVLPPTVKIKVHHSIQPHQKMSRTKEIPRSEKSCPRSKKGSHYWVYPL